MSSITEAHKNYAANGYTTFGLTLGKKIKDGKYKKEVFPITGFQNLKVDNQKCKSSDNALGLLCGQINGIIVIDIDKEEDWQKFLQKIGHADFDQSKICQQKTANGGCHLIFRFSQDLQSVTGKDHCFGSEYAIDIRTTGNFIYVDPTKYCDDDVDWKYKWINSPWETDIIEMPQFLKDHLLMNLTRGSKPRKERKVKEKKHFDANALSQSNRQVLVDFIKRNYGQDIAASKIKEENVDIEEDTLPSAMFQQTRQYFIPLNKFCPFKGSEHSSNHGNIIINRSGSKQKCHDGECVDENGKAKIHNYIQFDDLPLKIKELICMTPEKRDMALRQNVSLPFEDNKQTDIKQMNFDGAQLSVLSPSGTYTAFLPNNFYCPLCKKHHDYAQNSIIIDSQGRRYCICKLRLDSWYPNPVLTIPIHQTQVIFGNIIYHNTIHNYAVNTSEMFVPPNQFAEDNLIVHQEVALNKLFIKALDGTNSSVAQYFCELFKDKFRCFGRSDKWFEFKNHTWVQIKSERIAVKMVKEDVFENLSKAISFYHLNQTLKESEKKIKSIHNVQTKLSDDNFKQHVTRECEAFFYDMFDTFEDTLNKRNILTFNNGVVDLESFEFRNGHQNDNMSMSTEIDYVPYDPQNQIVIEIEEWLKEVQPDTQQRNYLKKLVGLFATNETNLQQIWIWTGAGQNAKSFFINKILAPCLGQFFRTASTQLLTRKRENANETNEALMSVASKRLIVFNEPGQGEVLQAETLKTLVGEDQITSRGLHQKQQLLEPKFKCVIVCNTIPKVSEDSYAVWRRIRVVNWPMTFKDDPDINNPLEAKLNRDLDKLVQRWPPYFAGCMIHWLQKYKEEGLSEPISVSKHTERYKEDNNPFSDFVSDHFEMTDSDDDRIKLCEIFNLCKCNKFIMSTGNKQKLKDALKHSGFNLNPSLRVPKSGNSTDAYSHIRRKMD